MIGWGLVGCGEIARKRVGPAIRDASGSVLEAVVSPIAAELDDFAERFGVPRKFADIEDMLALDSIGAVYIATPVFTHFDLAMKALRSGRHVLLEKPMAMTDDECAQLVAEADRRKVNLGIAYYRRFFPKLKEVRRLLREGVIGDVVQVRILYHSWRSETGSWRVVRSQAGGGPLWDIGSHKIDLLLDLVGMPVSVSALMDTLTQKYEVEDSCSALLKLENGAHCLAAFNWNSRVWSDEFEILGTEGKIVMDPCDGDGLEIRLNPRVVGGQGRETTRVSIPNHANLHFPLVEDFVGAIREGRQPAVPGREGARTNRVLAAIEASAIQGKRVDL